MEIKLFITTVIPIILKAFTIVGIIFQFSPCYFQLHFVLYDSSTLFNFNNPAIFEFIQRSFTIVAEQSIFRTKF